MSFVKKGASALGKLLTVVILAGAFAIGMLFVVYRSLQGEEIKVPEIVGKNFNETERELEALGLKVKKRADRYSEEKPDTILEQLPKPGDTVKTGQWIYVVTSRPNSEGEEKPATIQKGNTNVQDDTEKIEELISDKPKKKSNTNANTTKKKSSTTRDVINENSNSNTAAGNKNTTDSNKDGDKNKKEDPATAKPNTPANTGKPPAVKATPTGGETRPRRNP